MVSACLILMGTVVGQYPHQGSYGYGYFNRTPLPLYDPIRYARFYGGSGYYNFVPPAVASPKVLVPQRAITSLPGLTGRVVALNERQQLITLRLAAETVEVPYGPLTQFRAADGDFPEIKPGILINVNRNLITVIRKGQPAGDGSDIRR
jgi:hypothetical protein